MPISLKGRSFISLKDFTKDEIMYFLELSAQLKDKKRNKIYDPSLLYKNIALVFEKSSTRTRCAFTVACIDEGAHPEFLGKKDIQLGYKESVEDTARVLGRMFDGIQFRGFSQEVVEKLALYSGVPVWNGLTDDDHPTQVLADLLTIQENFHDLSEVHFAYFGDGRNNMSNALMIGATKVGMDITICAPKDLSPDKNLTEQCLAFAKQSGSKLTITSDINSVKNVNALYTDVWVSMGEEDKAAERIEALRPYQINMELVKNCAANNCIFMHCLPAVKEYEVTEEVFESPFSVVFDQAENRMHTIKAIMVATLGD